MTIYLYFFTFVAALIGLIAVDDDPTRVSLGEWVLYAMLLYAAVAFFRAAERYFREHRE